MFRSISKKTKTLIETVTPEVQKNKTVIETLPANSKSSAALQLPVRGNPVISTIKQNITQRLQLERSTSKNKTMLQNPVLFLVTVVNNCFNRNEKQNEKHNEKQKRSKKGTKQRLGRSLHISIIYVSMHVCTSNTTYTFATA